MATTQRPERADAKPSDSATATEHERRSLYPPGHWPSDDPYYVDDTLDAYPPLHLLRGKPTPEAMEAPRRLAAKRGYPTPHFPPDSDDGQEPLPPAAPPMNGAEADRPKRDPHRSHPAAMAAAGVPAALQEAVLSETLRRLLRLAA